jgi:hypothetical protein
LVGFEVGTDVGNAHNNGFRPGALAAAQTCAFDKDGAKKKLSGWHNLVL